MSFLAAALDILFPPLCLICRTSLDASHRAKHACDQCLATIPLFDTLRCAVCSGRLPDNKPVCHPKAPYLLAAIAPYNNRPAHSLIWQLKYESRTSALLPITVLIERYLNQLNYDFSPYTIVPIPLHTKRKRQRGFNQAQLLAECVAQHTGRPLVAALDKIKVTKPQAQAQSSAERLDNIKDCFTVSAPEAIYGNDVLLVDDVSTTGATLAEATRMLKIAGARKIIAFVFLKT